MKTVTAAIALSAIALLAGCAMQQPQGRPWWTLHEQDFRPVARTATTKDEVERLLGRPLDTMVFRNLNEEVWDYRFLNGTFPYIAEVHFDLQGRAKYYSMHEDKCPLMPSGCY